MNKRKIAFVLYIVICIIIISGLNQVKSFDGYYYSIDYLMAHQKTVADGAQKIALIENESGYVEIMNAEDSLLFYSFKSKSTLNNRKKYAVKTFSNVKIDYSSTSKTCSNKEDWHVFSVINLNDNEKNLAWCVVEKSNLNLAKNGVMCYEYKYRNKTYCLLSYFK